MDLHIDWIWGYFGEAHFQTNPMDGSMACENTVFNINLQLGMVRVFQIAACERFVICFFFLRSVDRCEPHRIGFLKPMKLRIHEQDGHIEFNGYCTVCRYFCTESSERTFISFPGHPVYPSTGRTWDDPFSGLKG